MTAEKNLVWYIGESIYEDWQFGSRTEFVNGVNTIVSGTEFDFSDYTAKLQVRVNPDESALVTLESPTTILDTNFDTGVVRVRGASNSKNCPVKCRQLRRCSSCPRRITGTT